MRIFCLIFLMLSICSCLSEPSIHTNTDISQCTSQSQIVSGLRQNLLSNRSGCEEKGDPLTGTLHIWGMDQNSHENSIRHFLETSDGEFHPIYFTDQVPTQYSSGIQIRISGIYIRCGNSLEIRSNQIESSIRSQASTLSSIGPQKFGVVLVSFQDYPNPFTHTQVGEKFFNQANHFIFENSYSQTWLEGQSFGPFPIPLNSTSVCSPETIAIYAKEVALQAGVDLSKWNRLLFVLPHNSCNWSGLGTVGGNPSHAWVNGTLDLHTLVHEVGHNLGLYHSNAWECDPAQKGSSCQTIEYGDTADAMGTYLPAHYNTFQKERLGWLTPTQRNLVQTVYQSGTYRVHSLESGDLGIKALKILKSLSTSGSSTYYYLEYRQNQGFDSIFSRLFLNHNLTSGVLVHTGRESRGDSSLLLNMNPNQKSWFLAGLSPNQEFRDPDAGLTLKITSTESESIQVEVTLSGGVSPPLSCD